jgi:hypothetical protein
MDTGFSIVLGCAVELRSSISLLTKQLIQRMEHVGLAQHLAVMDWSNPCVPKSCVNVNAAEVMRLKDSSRDIQAGGKIIT